MSTSVLIKSILTLISTILANALGGWPGAILMLVTIILWTVVTYAVFIDAKKRDKSKGFVGLTLLTGGLGGLIYYFATKD